MKYSFIVPVYNRPDEVRELLESMTKQTMKGFEVIIVEDGSKTPCKDVCDEFAGTLDIHYYYKDNSGPGQSRNYGAERAQGEWLIVLDSDVVLPEKYMESVECRVESGEWRVESLEFLRPFGSKPAELERATATKADDGTSNGILPAEEISAEEISAVARSSSAGLLPKGRKNSTLYTLNSKLNISAWGGPDASHPDFTPVQKAISYSMTSFFTTGGIRGGKTKLDKFFPRSYNMGIRREVYQELGGFSKMRFGEDIDFSYRIVEAGYKTALIPEAWVWHKRRTDFRKFFRQVYNSGIARINLTKRHPGTLKLVHLLPTVFTLGVIGLVLLSAVGRLLMYYCGNDQWRWLCLLPWLPIVLYSLVIFIDSTIKNKSLKVGLLSVPAAFVQLMGYGFGFIESWWKRCVLKQDEFTAFEKNFYS